MTLRRYQSAVIIKVHTTSSFEAQQNHSNMIFQSAPSGVNTKGGLMGWYPRASEPLNPLVPIPKEIEMQNMNDSPLANAGRNFFSYAQ